MGQRSKTIGTLIRWALALGLAALCLPAAGAGLLVFPQPLFPYSVTFQDLELHADRPFAKADGERLLADIRERIGRSALDRRQGVHRIFIAQTSWRERLTFLWSYGAGGLNYYPLTRNVFLRRSDIARGLLISPLGTPVPPPRTLAYFGAHEIAHSLTGERVGPLGYARMPIWIREGLADAIALPGRGDYEALVRAYRAGERDLDPARSGLYTRYRLLVTFFLEREGWSIDRLLASPMSLEEAETVFARSLAQTS
jgi:hypothetical protein